MKKRKFNLLLQMATLCLCVAAIAFGVYSAKNANLNVRGTVGFNAHNCDVDVTAYIYGDSAVEDTSTAAASELGVVRSSSHKKQLGTAQVKGDNDKTISLGNFYFCDMTADDTIAPIYIVFELTNQSMFDVDISATTTFTPADDNITPVSSGTVTLKDKSAETADKKKELTITLTLSPTTSAVKDTKITITLDMNKSQTQTFNSTAERNYYEFKTQKPELYSIYHELECNYSYGIDELLTALKENKNYFDATGFDDIYASLYNQEYECVSQGIVFAEDSLCVYNGNGENLYKDNSGMISGVGDYFLMFYYKELPQIKSNKTWSIKGHSEAVSGGEISDFKILALNLDTYDFVLYEEGKNDFSYDGKTKSVEFTCEHMPFMGILLTLQ